MQSGILRAFGAALFALLMTITGIGPGPRPASRTSSSSGRRPSAGFNISAYNHA